MRNRHLILAAIFVAIPGAIGLATFCARQARSAAQDPERTFEETRVALKSDDDDERLDAIMSLGDFPDRLEEATETALPFLVSRTDLEVIAAEIAFRKFGPGAVPLLERSLQTDDILKLNAACNGLGLFGGEAASAAPRLVELLQSGERDVIFCACKGLENMGAAAAPAVPGAIELLQHEDFNIQIRACKVLATCGEHAVPALEPLLELAANGLPSASSSAAIPLGAIGRHEPDPRIIETLRAKLGAFHVVQRERALAGLALMGENGAELLPEIEALLTAPERSVIPDAAIAHFSVTGDAEPAANALLTAARNVNSAERAMNAILELPKDANVDGRFTRLFLEQLDSDEAWQREIALHGLDVMGRDEAEREKVTAALEQIENNDEDTLLRKMASLVSAAIANGGPSFIR